MAAAFPCVMVSTAMQGGCTCENSSYLRIGPGNIEFAALFAPKPLGMTAANDWTKEMETKGFPDLKKLYTMLGVPDRVEAHFNIQFPHNYNARLPRADVCVLQPALQTGAGRCRAAGTRLHALDHAGVERLGRQASRSQPATRSGEPHEIAVVEWFKKDRRAGRTAARRSRRDCKHARCSAARGRS